MKKALLIIFIILIFAAIFYSLWGRDLCYNLRDRVYWAELSEKITVSQVHEVLLDGKVVLEGEEFTGFVEKLGNAEYFRSNWQKHGPTGPIITITFKDGLSEHFQYWGKGIYETFHKKGQFLVRNLELDATLEKYHINDFY